jgi:phosphatidylglycerophosphate synthase
MVTCMKYLEIIFSEEYINKAAVKNNFILYLMYRIAYPFSYMLMKVGLSANTITTLSIVTSLLAFLSLVYDFSPVFFISLWGVSILLDFCDGTVARMTDNVRTSAFRYDLMSDLFKVSLILVGVSFKYNTLTIWSMSSIVIFLFLYYTVLSHDLLSSNKLNTFLDGNSNLSERDDTGFINIIKSMLYINGSHSFLSRSLRILIHNLLTILFGIKGHTLLIFLLFPFGSNYVVSILVYLICLLSFMSFRAVIGLLNTPKVSI